jgi:hypothetical protein
MLGFARRARDANVPQPNLLIYFKGAIFNPRKMLGFVPQPNLLIYLIQEWGKGEAFRHISY